MSTESAVAAGITATILSPRARETVRRGAVLGVAGVLKVGDVVTGAARGVGRGIRGGGQAPQAEPEAATSTAKRSPASEASADVAMP